MSNTTHNVYLDHNATTPVDAEILAEMLPYLSGLSGEYGNAGSIHSFGQRARGAVERARTAVAELIGARASEIIFTSGGTEADNAAIFGVVGAGADAASRTRHVITTQIEHAAVLEACRALERRGVAVTYVGVSAGGVVDPDDI